MSKFKKFLQITIFFLFTIFIFAVGYVLNIYINHYSDLNELIDYNPKLTTRIYDKNDNLIANVFDGEHRIYATYEQIPARLIETIMAVEDTNFFNHPGINVDGIIRAVVKNIQAGSKVEGASTITQQVVRNVLNYTKEKNIDRKIKEIVISLLIERRLTKEEILTRYINHVFLGHGYYGFRTASLGYFKKELDQLNLKEMAMLASIPKSPTKYNPTKYYENSLNRANDIINRMYNIGWCDKTEYEQSLASSPEVFDESLTQNKAPFVVDELLRQGENLFDTDFKKGGYKVTLTIDLPTQEIAQEAVKFGYERIINKEESLLEAENGNTTQTPEERQAYLDEKYKLLNGAMIVTQQKTGKILALVGGVDYNKNSYNRVTQAKRQIGSSIKPFIYMSALNLGYHNLNQIADISRIFDTQTNKQINDNADAQINADILSKAMEENQKEGNKEDGEEIWKPKNYSNNMKGFMTLEDAIVKSSNLATINLVLDIGLNYIYEDIKKIGFEHVPQDLSITLGSITDSLLGMSEKFSRFSNYGEETKSYMIDSIEDKFGNVISFHKSSQRVLEESQAFLMVNILKEVVKRGSGWRARVKGIELGGKTGTTNNNIDTWFNGFSPTVQAITWFGYDDNRPIGEKQTGGSTAAPAFQYFMKKYLALNPQIKREFDVPFGVKERIINGKKVYFTDKTLIPTKSDTPLNNFEEELIF